MIIDIAWFCMQEKFYTIVWEIFMFNTFRMLKFRTGKCTKYFQDNFIP